MGAETTNETSDTFEVERDKILPPTKKKREEPEDQMEATPLPPLDTPTHEPQKHV